DGDETRAPEGTRWVRRGCGGGCWSWGLAPWGRARPERASGAPTTTSSWALAGTTPRDRIQGGVAPRAASRVSEVSRAGEGASNPTRRAAAVARSPWSRAEGRARAAGAAPKTRVGEAPGARVGGPNLPILRDLLTLRSPRNPRNRSAAGTPSAAAGAAPTAVACPVGATSTARGTPAGPAAARESVFNARRPTSAARPSAATLAVPRA